MTGERSRLLTGWGGTTTSRAQVAGPVGGARAVSELLTARPPHGVLVRGSGCSYGDAAQNAGGLVLAPLNRPCIELDPVTATVRATASTTFAELLSEIVPKGLLLPVLPGTRHLTLGGAIAADVHGKNQRRDGTISDWLESIELIDGQGRLLTLTPDVDAGCTAFRATVGGMGLTGVIWAATVRLLRISSSSMRVTVRRAGDLDDLMAGLDAATSRYSVAWIDTTAQGRALGRGVLDLGDHLSKPDTATEEETAAYRRSPALRAPRLPFSPITPLTARAFNTLWYRKAPRERHTTTSLPAFFHRLDAVSGWNRALGPRGILQYQFAVPDASGHVIADALRALQQYGGAPFLGTLKRFGPANGNPLSFPLPGWSLAVDLPAHRPGLAGLLDALDRKVAEAGGRVYLAKDARLSRRRFREMYGVSDEWHRARAALDPDDVMRSDLGRRLGLCR